MHMNISPIFSMKHGFLLDAPLSFLFFHIVSLGLARTAKIPKFSPSLDDEIVGLRWLLSLACQMKSFGNLVLIFLSNTISTTHLS